MNSDDESLITNPESQPDTPLPRDHLEFQIRVRGIFYTLRVQYAWQ
jgi:hypothetical protein